MCVCVCVIQAAADSRSRSRTRGAGVMYHTCIRCVAYDTFITRCAAVLLVRESIQGFPCAHGDGHASYAEAEYAMNFFQARFGTEPSHQAAADSGCIYSGRKLGGPAPNHGGGPPAPKKLIFSKGRLKGNPIFLTPTAGRKSRAGAVLGRKFLLLIKKKEGARQFLLLIRKK